MVVAYLMTVTHYSWEECLSAVKAVRSFVGPNYGFQQQLQEYQTTQVSEVHTKKHKDMMSTRTQYLDPFFPHWPFLAVALHYISIQMHLYVMCCSW